MSLTQITTVSVIKFNVLANIQSRSNSVNLEEKLFKNSAFVHIIIKLEMCKILSLRFDEVKTCLGLILILAK